MGNKRKCRHCKEYTKDFVVFNLSAFCNNEHAIAYGLANKEKAKEKARKERIKAFNDETKARNKALKTKPELTAEAQKVVNLYVRMRDKGKPCVSCGASEREIESEQGWKVGGAWDAGHYRGRGAASHLRFNLLNIHRQCKSCNGGERKNSGKAQTVAKAYREELIKRIGLDRVEKLENDNKPRTFSREYLIRVKKIFAKRARLYKKLKS